jgi:hypothetical protein
MKIDTEGEVAMAQALGYPIADPEQVRHVVEELRKAYEFALSHPPTGKEVGFIDGFMAMPNFVRLVVEDLEMRSRFQTTDQKYAFRRLMIDTITRSLLKRLEE